MDKSQSQKNWFLLILLCLVQVGTTSDTSILANMMSALSQTFNASIADIQLANIIYPLISGAMMMLGGVLGMRFGWKRLLITGNIILAAGEATAFFSPNITTFTFVARVLVGLGASFAIPATIGLVMVVYQGQQRAIAFSALAAANGIASALGPILGGWIIMSLNWRDNYIWLSGLFFTLFILFLCQKNLNTPRKPIKIDFIGSVTIIAGLVFFIYGLAKISVWGAFQPVHPPFTFFSLSPSPFFILFGILLMWLFSLWEAHKEHQHQDTVLPQIFIKNSASKSGLMMNAIVFLILGGVMFTLVTFLQIVLKYNPVETGLFLLCFAVGITLFSLGTPIALPRISPKIICRAGIIISAIACFFIALGLKETSINLWLLIPGLFFCGAGVGFLSSQASNVVSNAVPKNLAETSAGVQGATRNIGNAIGIAAVGLVLILSLTTSVKNTVAASSNIPNTDKHRVMLIKNVPFISTPDLINLLSKNNASENIEKKFITINLHSRIIAMRTTLLTLAIIILLSLFFTRGLPDKKLPQGEKND